jgi:phosphate transport system permease protein
MSESGPIRSSEDARLRARYRAERRFRLYGQLAIGFAILALLVLLVSVGTESVSALTQFELELEVELGEGAIDPRGERDLDELRVGNYAAPIREALRAEVPEARGRSEKRALYALLSVGAEYDLQAFVMENPETIGTTRSFRLPLSDDADLYFKGRIDADVPESDRKLSDRQIAWLDSLAAAGRVERRLNWRFFSSGDSREPELAGIQGAIRGSFLTLLVTLVLSFPIGVAAAVYLEEFAPRNRFTDLIEVNINNLAAVPSIVFGLLGLAVFLNVFGMPRSAPLVGGVVLALMTLPTLIIASRAALQAAALDPGGRARCGGLSHAGRARSRPAPGIAGNPDGDDHRNGEGARRDRAPADDRHGRLHRRPALGLW